MPQPKPFWYGLLIAITYFLSVFFAVAALTPSLALQAGMIAAILAVAVYMILVLAGQEEHGRPLGILLFAPAIFVTAGAVWWVLRLLGVWKIN